VGGMTACATWEGTTREDPAIANIDASSPLVFSFPFQVKCKVGGLELDDSPARSTHIRMRLP